eukprot:m.372260 g.372260  ORF g.372260 m.372260 type:complete len:60 (+) comp62585_c0_seq1:118-297(+)
MLCIILSQGCHNAQVVMKHQFSTTPSPLMFTSNMCVFVLNSRFEIHVVYEWQSQPTERC